MQARKIEWLSPFRADGSRFPGHTLNIWLQFLQPFSLLLISDTIRLEMLGIVANLTKRNAVADFKAKFRMIGEWFNVMSIEVAAFRVTTFLAGKFIPTINIKPPPFIFFGKSLP